MVSRAAHYRAKAKHAQREFGYIKPTVIREEDWIEEAIDAARELGEGGANIYCAVFADDMAVSYELADHILRHLSKLGVVHMSAERKPDGEFVRYVWRLPQ